MDQVRHSRKKIPHRQSKRVLVLALAVLALTAIGSTLAYFYHSSNPVENSFAPSEITCEIEEKVEDAEKSSVKVKNTGKTDAFIRVAVIANTVDKDGNINGGADVSSYLKGEDWVRNGLYYYYTKPVAPNGLTGDLLDEESPISLEGLRVTILAEAIQSEPSGAEGAAMDAWGVDPAALGEDE